MKSVIIRRKRSGQAVFLFCSVMVFVFFILMIFSSEIPQEFRGFFSAVGWAGSILAGINLLFRIRRMIRPRPLLIANTEGLFDFSLPSSLGFISWEEINNIMSVSVHGERYVGVEIPRIRELMETAGSRYTAAQKNAVKSNLSLGYPAMLIQLLPSGENPSSIAEFLTDYRKEALLEKRKAKNEGKSCSSSPVPSYHPALLHHFKKG
ncbi:MAG: STM3941 family protein [Hydrogeniiclostridium sp.]